jgi:hypothetical protein
VSVVLLRAIKLLVPPPPPPPPLLLRKLSSGDIWDESVISARAAEEALSPPSGAGCLPACPLVPSFFLFVAGATEKEEKKGVHLFAAAAARSLALEEESNF